MALFTDLVADTDSLKFREMLDLMSMFLNANETDIIKPNEQPLPIEKSLNNPSPNYDDCFSDTNNETDSILDKAFNKSSIVSFNKYPVGPILEYLIFVTCIICLITLTFVYSVIFNIVCQFSKFFFSS